MGIGTIKSIKFDLRVGAALFILGTSFLMLYYFFPSQQDLIKYASAMIGGLAALYSAYYLGASVHENQRSEKITNSIKLIVLFNEVNFAEQTKILFNDLGHENITKAEFYNRISNEPQLLQAVIALLHYFSRLAVSIKMGHSDEKTLYMSLDTFLPQVFSILKPFVDETRRIRGSQNIYRNAEDLSNSWSAKRYLSTGLPVENIYNDARAVQR